MLISLSQLVSCVCLVDGYAKGPALIKSVLFQDGCKQGFVCAVADEFCTVVPPVFTAVCYDCSSVVLGQQIVVFAELPVKCRI